MFQWIATGIQDGIYWLLLTLDATIYWFISYAYRIFMILSRIRIFQDDTIEVFANRIYVIMGVVMLFIVSYALLKYIINPDSKGTDGKKIITNTIKALILVTIMPAIFNFAFVVQNAVVENNILGKIILGGNNKVTDEQQFDTDVLNHGGNIIAVSVFQVFFYPAIQENDDVTTVATVDPVTYSDTTYTYDEAVSKVKENGDFYLFRAFNTSLTKGQITYRFIISTIVGIYVLYLLVSYCIDLAIRVVKLSFYQLIAPIPILSLIVPGQENLFKNWQKNAISTYLQVFIRLIIIFFSVFMITVIVENAPKWANSNMFGDYNLSLTETLLISAFLIIGILTFMRQAPKLISDLFGINFDGGGSLASKLGAGGAFAMGGMVGGAFGRAANNFRAGRKDPNGNAWRTARSTLGGFFSGGYKGARSNVNSSTYSGFAKNTANATSSTYKNKKSSGSNRKPGPNPRPNPGTNPRTLGLAGPTPGSTPGPNPGSTPGPNPGSTPGPNPGPTPGPNPGPTPGPNPGPIPGPNSGPNLKPRDVTLDMALNYYGLDENTTWNEIRKKHKEVMKKTHPDTGVDDAEAKIANEYFDLLKQNYL